ncbi:MAG: pyruvate:ferredoxin (flavodoxin) oxidoreductase [Planctomycetales bacterium]|nr:pyruvate:ferredoxin (flavodoxin) oxidoreductase [Planctomycetales bacterium]
MPETHIIVDGNEAATRIAYQCSEVAAIYPITPASPMGELVDAWSSAGRENLFGTVPRVIEMQSEGGAAGAVHGSLQAGALTTTFTASQGLLLMIPNMFKIAGELTPTVFHVAARSIATHALSIFGDHSDVMSARMTGWAMLASSSVQEAHDLALVSHAATLKTRLPFLHFFDGFRTSHELNCIKALPADIISAMMDLDLIKAHRDRALNPDSPMLRGSAQNPDVFFQAREAVNPYYDACPGIVQEAMDRFAELTGRSYRLFDYVGAANATRVIVLMGSGAGAVEEVVQHLNARGEKVGVLKVRLYRPFDIAAFLHGLPATTEQIAVLDRTKEPGAVGEPLYTDVVAALVDHWAARAPGASLPRVIGGRYGLSSKEFTPAMVLSIFAELDRQDPKRRFTVGINDDVTHLSLDYDPTQWQEPNDVRRAVFFGLGSDGTVGANKNSVKIIGESTPMHAQGYFVYDSKKSGSVTISHLRFSERPIESSYLIEQANFVACHQFQFLESRDVLELAAPGATFLLNSPYGADEVWDKLPVEVQQQIIDKRLRLFVIDGYHVAREAGMGGRINTVMQTCFFALAEVLPIDLAIEAIKKAIRKTYGSRGEAVVRRNEEAVDSALSALHEVQIPATATSDLRRRQLVPDDAPDFVKRVTGLMMAGLGDKLPVSAMPVDGAFPTGTAQFEKRRIAASIPVWDPGVCIQCGLCALVCPHAAIRSKAYPTDALNGAPDGFKTVGWSGKDLDGYSMTIQVAPDDCTGCSVCVDVCPARSKEVARHKAINMEPALDHADRERDWYDYFLGLPEIDRTLAAHDQVKGSQLLQPLFEYSGACAGCGETPYLKLITQLVGDRLLIANATGCSSIFGGNLPTTPWTTNAEGRGPAWSNSLFEDNAEFGLGMRLAVDEQTRFAAAQLKKFAGQLGDDLVRATVEAPQTTEPEINAQRERLQQIRQRLEGLDSAEARLLTSTLHALVRRSVWIVGGDGWAYDIGFGGLDHVLASGEDVNILVLDTQVYSNTGGQASKATPLGAIAKFAAAGKPIRRKDLGMLAVDYGSVYVAQIAMGSQPLQTIRAMQEAESYPGTSLVIAYSPCIAHGIDMSQTMTHQKDVTASGFWPLFRYDPRNAREGLLPFRLDSRRPKTTFREFAMKEARFATLARANPQHAERLFAMAQQEINDRWHFYEQMAGIERDFAQNEPEEATTA